MNSLQGQTGNQSAAFPWKLTQGDPTVPVDSGSGPWIVAPAWAKDKLLSYRKQLLFPITTQTPFYSSFYRCFVHKADYHQRQYNFSMWVDYF